MANLTSAQEEDYLPLTEEKYGPYLNQSLEYYSRDEAFANWSDFHKGKFITEVCKNRTEMLTFDTVQLVRVIVTWTLFFISAVGNIFVLLCVCRRSRTSHVHMIMLHFAIADLAFTFLVLPEDALWNTTMQWYGGDLLCRACQMGKHIGMYISSFMVVVMAVDRCCGILQPMCTVSKQRRRTKYLVGGAWVLSVISAIPPAILFSLAKAPFCADMEPFLQCVDSNVVPQEKLKPYYFFTMVMSFLLPMILCTVCYSLVIYEISNMMQRDRVMMGRRDSSVGITRARKKTLKMTALVTLTFLLFWGPYYAYGIYYWFTAGQLSQQISIALFTLMYVHPAVHPFIYGVLMKDVRNTFRTMMLHLEKIITCSASELSCGDGSCLQSPEKTHCSHGNGYVRSVNADPPSNGVSDENAHSITMTDRRNHSERDRLISANSSDHVSEDAFPRLQTLSCDTASARSTTRTSAVSFNLPPPEETRENGRPGINNNGEVVDRKNGDILKSTDV